ncbi:Membrane associated serine protease, rhomboid family [Thalassolituus maritimus]|uniref:Membrane associated serine protease, rhomboid family n=1 Tax=Thalassolituus maritimus TaxID=484498 RepID=A0A1N7QCD5_9GAMM|nr:rhomboid family intramembrane serine protease [Thalassolituus maritimus]SIT20525.1 Membrane associated serine protease, rhomboid family [Thalassolituus maritimus]
MQLNFFRALANVLGLTWARVRSDFLSHSWVTIALGVTVTALMFVPEADNYLRFDRAAIIEDREWWRTFTAVLVHSSWDHYFWNIIVLLASSLVCEQINRRAFVIYLIAVITITAAYKLTLAAPGHISLGFSGVASGTFVLLLVLIIAEGYRTRDFWMMIVTAVILTVFSAHELGFFGSESGWEMLTGHSIDATPGKKTKPAHILGMITGLVVGLAYLLAPAIKAKADKR